MTAHNGAAFIRQGIESVLAQSLRNFELIVVDNGSVDATCAILGSYDDSRLIVIRNARNLGIVAGRNQGFAAARGEYVAALDHDDVSLPTRLAAQVAYLDSNERVVLVGTDIMIDSNGRLERPQSPDTTTPPLLRWLLHVENPLTYSSVMFRAAAVRRLGAFMREEFEFAEDFDLYHRLLARGEIARLDQPLTVYRLHAANTSRKAGAEVFRASVRVLASAYRAWLGSQAEDAAGLVIRHLSDRQPPRTAATLERLRHCLERLLSGFLSAYPQSPEEERRIRAHAGAAWWAAVRAAVRSGRPWLAGRCFERAGLAADARPSVSDQARSIAIGMLRMPRQLGRR